MALVNKMEQLTLEKESKHSEVQCTYSIVIGDDGSKCLQIDTYGSNTRKYKGKKSQSIRLSPQAIVQLKQILSKI